MSRLSSTSIPPYGCSKGAADQYMLDYAGIFGLKTVFFRHSSMFGVRQFATYDQGWVGWFFQKAKEAKNGTTKQSFTISGTGKQVRDVLHAGNMKRLYMADIYQIDIAKGQAFNVGGGIANSLSLLDLFTHLKDLSGVKINYTKISVRESDKRVFVLDLTKVNKILGWQPAVTSREGVTHMFEWIGQMQ
jgi:CDP-paratose 2-epimerase